MSSSHYDILILGAGAAGLAAAIFAGKLAEGKLRIGLVDGAQKPGAKILVSGGGRCNVTNQNVTPEDYEGGPRTIIRNVLRAFDHHHTLQWMEELGVELKLEPTGKYFPVSDKARTVLDALMNRAQSLGVKQLFGTRVTQIEANENSFTLNSSAGSLTCRKLIIATGGRSLPKSGSDGWGLDQLKRLGHQIVPTTPALVPLVLNANASPGGRFGELSGLTLNMRIALFKTNGKLLAERTGSLLFTHFGISGPAALDFSRHWLRAEEETLTTIGHPEFRTVDDADAWLLQQTKENSKRTAANVLQIIFPERYARLIASDGGKLSELPKAQRRALAANIARLPIDVQSARGWSYAETTAGGVELREIDAATMASRIVPNLHICGEILDADGRIGGFNFQWAWASGYLAGRGAARK